MKPQVAVQPVAIKTRIPLDVARHSDLTSHFRDNLAHHSGMMSDAEGRSCIYAPITQNEKLVDSQGYVLDLEE